MRGRLRWPCRRASRLPPGRITVRSRSTSIAGDRHLSLASQLPTLAGHDDAAQPAPRIDTRAMSPPSQDPPRAPGRVVRLRMPLAVPPPPRDQNVLPYEITLADPISGLKGYETAAGTPDEVPGLRPQEANTLGDARENGEQAQVFIPGTIDRLSSPLRRTTGAKAEGRPAVFPGLAGTQSAPAVTLCRSTACLLTHTSQAAVRPEGAPAMPRHIGVEPFSGLGAAIARHWTRPLRRCRA